MDTAKDAGLYGQGMVVLHEIKGNPVFFEHLPIVGFREKTAIISKLLWPDDFNVRNFQRNNFHVPIIRSQVR